MLHYGARSRPTPAAAAATSHRAQTHRRAELAWHRCRRVKMNDPFWNNRPSAEQMVEQKPFDVRGLDDVVVQQVGLTGQEHRPGREVVGRTTV